MRRFGRWVADWLALLKLSLRWQLGRRAWLVPLLALAWPAYRAFELMAGWRARRFEPEDAQNALIGIPLTVILMFSRSAEGRSGQTLGLRLTANNFVRVTGPIVFGAVGSALGLAAVFWIVGAIMAAGGFIARRGAPSR